MSEVKKTKKEMLIERKQQIEAQLKAINARESAINRKLETRRKVILGALLMNEAKNNDNINKLLNYLISKVDEKDKSLFTS